VHHGSATSMHSSGDRRAAPRRAIEMERLAQLDDRSPCGQPGHAQDGVVPSRGVAVKVGERMFWILEEARAKSVDTARLSDDVLPYELDGVSRRGREPASAGEGGSMNCSRRRCRAASSVAG
jgi:hypothetical protein